MPGGQAPGSPCCPQGWGWGPVGGHSLGNAHGGLLADVCSRCVPPGVCPQVCAPWVGVPCKGAVVSPRTHSCLSIPKVGVRASVSHGQLPRRHSGVLEPERPAADSISDPG